MKIDSPLTNIQGYLDEFKGFASNEEFIKRTEDLRRLIGIHQKVKEGLELDSKDLRFLYQVDSPIDDFDFGEDLGVADLLNGRDKEKDILNLFECEKSQIARSKDQINESTKIYIGPVSKDIFESLKKFKIDYIYTSFPGSRIKIQDLEVESETKSAIRSQLETSVDIQSSGYAKELLGVEGFTTVVDRTSGSVGLTQEDKDLLIKEHPGALNRNYTLVTLSTEDLGFSNAPTLKEIYEKAKTLGLELCPSELGPKFRLKLKDQARNDLVYVGMEPITDQPGDPHIFSIARHEDELWLDDAWTRDTYKFDTKAKFIFSLSR